VQLGTGIAFEITMLWFAGLKAVVNAVAFGVNALARKPAKTIERTDARTASFMIGLPPGVLV
jgi:cytochrome P450